MLTRLQCAAALALLWLSLPGLARSEGDARAIVERAFEAARINEAKVRDYVYHERIEERRFDRQGSEKRRNSQTWDVTLFETGDYRRLIARNDQPLDRAAEARERRKLDKHIRRLQNETPAQRARRLARVDRERREELRFLEEITRAFDFRLLGSEAIDGIATHVISAEPRKGYKPPNRRARVLTKVRAKLWISQEDFGWVQAEIETFGDISWGVAVYRLTKGARIAFRQRRLDDGVWVAESWRVRLKARIALVYRLDAEFTGTYSNFRRFTTDTTVTGWSRTD